MPLRPLALAWPSLVRHALVALVLSPLTSAQAPEVSSLSIDPPGDVSEPVALAYTPDGSRVVITHQSGHLTRYDVVAGAVTGSTRPGTMLRGITMLPGGAQCLVVEREGGGRLLRVDLASLAVTSSVALNQVAAERVELSSNAAFAYVTSAFGQPSVRVVDLATMSVTSAFDVGYGANSSRRMEKRTLLPDDVTLVGLNPGYNSLEFHDIQTGALQTTLFVHGPTISHPVVSADGRVALVGLREGISFNKLAVIDLVARAVTGTFQMQANIAGESFFDLLVSDDGSRATYSAGTHGLHFVDTATGAGGTLPLHVSRIVPTFDGQYLLAIGLDAAVIDTLTETVAAPLPPPPTAYLGGAQTLPVTSPTAHAAVALDYGQSDDLFLYDLDPATAGLVATSGTDAGISVEEPRGAAIGGGIALTINNQSDNVTVIDVVTQTVLGWVPVGDEPGVGAVTQDGSWAVVGNRFDNSISIVDVANLSEAARVPLPAQPYLLVLSPDGSRAYVTLSGSGGPDQIAVLDVAGAASSLVTTLGVGTSQPAFAPVVSPDGTRLALEFVNPTRIGVFDTTTLGLIDLFDPGGSVSELTFGQSSDRLYGGVGTSIQEYLITPSGLVAGGAQALTGGPRAMAVTADAWFVTVSNATQLLAGPLSSIAGPDVTPARVELSSYDVWLFASGTRVIARTREFNAPDLLERFDFSGGTLTSAGATDVPGTALDVAFDPTIGQMLLAVDTSSTDDVCLLADLATGAPTSYCNQSAANSTGLTGRLVATGPPWVGTSLLELQALRLPPGQTALFLASRSATFVPNAGGSQGDLCIATPFGRFAPLTIDASGRAGQPLDTGALPLGGGTQAVLVGESWFFQAWHRDQNPGSTSNFTDALEIVFR